MPIDTDDIAPPPVRTPGFGEVDLERLSIVELEARIVALEAEIARVRGAIAAKQKQRSAADALFRKS
ncbi:DUF1192 domain-containing protein [Zavarzinia sp. CC-PAN008]|uniref:DUF1192 domain-containing protein n=1 Tax=Zavarzinia sp. CC-PAN008 TaxID=3243332 RepID=UPI003F746324